MTSWTTRKPKEKLESLGRTDPNNNLNFFYQIMKVTSEQRIVKLPDRKIYFGNGTQKKRLEPNWRTFFLTWILKT